MNDFSYILKYLRYSLFAGYSGGYRIHSPFLFHLVTVIIEDFNPFYAFDTIEKIRAELLRSEKVITIQDFGAGSRVFKSNQRAVKDIAMHSIIKPKYGQLLFRLVNHFKPRTLVELGTSLGVGSLYLAMPDSRSKLYTIEGCPETAAVAKQNFAQAGVRNIELLTGQFSDVLPGLLGKIKQVDLVFFDGNHTKEATLSYFEACLPFITSETVLVFDDIHWSAGMEQAWEIIKKHSQVTLSIDLFFMGIVFFGKGLQKQNYVIKF